MMILSKHKFIFLAAGTAFLAACQPAAPPAPAAPPPVKFGPRAPTPPNGASTSFVTPSLRSDGLRQTVNRDIGPLETVWHVRSALNVAALSCRDAKYSQLADEYNQFLRNNKSALRNANNAIIAKFRRENGRGYRKVHDRHSTSVYNYWSFSPLRREFCATAASVSKKAIATSSSNLKTFGAQALQDLERPFTEFYLAYEQYQKDIAAWRAKNGS